MYYTYDITIGTVSLSNPLDQKRTHLTGKRYLQVPYNTTMRQGTPNVKITYFVFALLFLTLHSTSSAQEFDFVIQKMRLLISVNHDDHIFQRFDFQFIDTHVITHYLSEYSFIASAMFAYLYISIA